LRVEGGGGEERLIGRQGEGARALYVPRRRLLVEAALACLLCAVVARCLVESGRTSSCGRSFGTLRRRASASLCALACEIESMCRRGRASHLWQEKGRGEEEARRGREAGLCSCSSCAESPSLSPSALQSSYSSTRLCSVSVLSCTRLPSPRRPPLDPHPSPLRRHLLVDLAWRPPARPLRQTRTATTRSARAATPRRPHARPCAAQRRLPTQSRRRAGGGNRSQT